MKLTKTRSVLMILTLALLVLTLGLGLVFLPKSTTASADESTPELVPLADADLLNTTAFKTGDGGAPHGVFWDATHSQLRLLYKVVGGNPNRLTNAPQNQYRNVELIEITAGGETKSIKDWAEIVWADNMGGANGDTSVGEIWINSTNRTWIDSITEVHYKVGFAEKDNAGADTNVKTTKEYTLWNGGMYGWQTRVDNTKPLEVNYTGEDTIAWGGQIDTSKLEVKATPMGASEAVKIDAGCYTLEYDPYQAGQQTVKVKYQDLEEKTFSITVQDVDANKGLQVVAENTPATTYNATQMAFYFQVKGDSPKPDTSTNTSAWTDPSCHVLDKLLFNGQGQDSWSQHIAWVSYFKHLSPSDSIFEISLCVKEGDPQDAEHKAWLSGIQTVTFKTGFYLKNTNDPNGELVVNDETTLYNAHAAGWQRAVESISATYTGGDVAVGGELDLSKLTVTGKFMDKSADATIDSSKVSVQLPSAAGAGKATISYQEKTCEVDVNMTATQTLQSIEVTSENYSALRWTYPTFSDLKVVAHFEGEEDGGTELSADQFTVTGYDMWGEVGSTTQATVSYTYVEGQTKTTTFNITITENTTTDKYLDVIPGKSFNGTNNGGQDGTGMMFGDRALLSVQIKIVGFDLGYDLGNRNSIGFELIKGMHFVDYIDFVYDGSPKTLQELLDDGTIKSAGTSDNGVLVFWFADAANRAKVSQVHCKAGMQWPKQVGDHWDAINEGTDSVTAGSELLSDLVLKHDVYLENGGAQGWLKIVEELTATPTVEEITQGTSTEDLKSKLTVEVQYKGETEKTTLNANDYTVELDTSNVNDSVQGTVTYRGKTANFTVKVVAAPKTLERIEVESYEAERWTYPTFDDLVVKAYFTGEEQPTTLQKGEYTVTGYDMWATGATTTATVTYNYGGTEKTAELTINLTNYTDGKYMRVVRGDELAYNTNFQWPGQEWHFLQFTVRFVGFGLDGRGLVTTEFWQDCNNDNLQQHEAAHLGDYILVKVASGEEKTATQWISDGKIDSIASGNSGNLLLRIENAEFRASVIQVTLKAGLEWVASTTLGRQADHFIGNQDDKNSVYMTVPGAVLTTDYVLYNGVNSSWLKGVTELTAEYDSDSEVVLNGEVDRTKLTVMATYYDAQDAVKLGDNDYTVTLDSSAAGESVTGTVTYRGMTAEFSVKVVAPENALESLIVTGKGTVKRFESSSTATGFTLKAHYSDGTEEDVTSGYTIAEIDAWAAVGNEQTVKVTYKDESGQQVQADLTIVIAEPDTTKGLKVLYDYTEDRKTWWWSQPAPKTSQLILYFDIVGEGIGQPDMTSANLSFLGNPHFNDYILINGKSIKECGFPSNGWAGSFYSVLGYEGALNAHALWFDPSYAADYATPSDWRDTVKTVTIKAGFQWYDKNGAVEGAVVKEDITIWNAQLNWQLYADDIEVAAKADAKFVKGTEDIKDLLEVKAVYGEEKTAITNYTIENYAKDTLGEQTITVKYQDHEKTLKINVEEGETPPPATQYTVKFAVGDHAAAGEKAPNEQKANKDAQITLPAAPKAAEGYKFDGWYDGTTKVGDANAKYTVTKDVTLTAHWAKDETPVEPGPGGDQPGGDQPANPENPDGNEPAEDEGCGSVISVSGMIIAFVTLLGAAVVVITVRKQRN